MYWQEIRRISLAIGLLVATAVLIWNINQERRLPHIVFVCLISFFASSLIILLALRYVGKVLQDYLNEQQLQAAAEDKRRLEEEQRKAEDALAKVKSEESTRKDKLMVDAKAAIDKKSKK
jgi:thiol:disulfide interchange protein